MAYGFISGFILTFILAWFTGSTALLGLSGCFAILGALGGLIPDIDRVEQLGPLRLTHRKTLHYPIGYGILALIFVYIGIYMNVKCIGCASLFLGAWLHSFMDIFDDFYRDPEHGVYEHISRKWIKPLRIIPFASLREWSLQSFCDIVAIAVSPFISGVCILSGWELTTLSFFIIWLVSTVYEFKRTVPKRLAMISEGLKNKQNVNILKKPADPNFCAASGRSVFCNSTVSLSLKRPSA